MQALNSRLYAGKSDLDDLLELQRSCRRLEWTGDYPNPTDLRELLSLARVKENTRLWYGADGHLAGWALVDHYCNLLFEFLPGVLSQELIAEIGAWGIECIRRLAQPEDEMPALDASCRGDDLERTAILGQLGFIQQEVQTLHYTRSLAVEIPEARLPEGFSLRTAFGENEAGALVALHRVAFDTENMTVEERLAMMRSPVYDPALDLVVVSPDGELAGNCLCTFSREENLISERNEGWTDPIAVHPKFQRMGLAKALLLTGMRLLQTRGAEVVRLGTSSENLPMQRAAEAVGFRVESVRLWFSMRIRELL